MPKTSTWEQDTERGAVVLDGLVMAWDIDGVPTLLGDSRKIDTKRFNEWARDWVASAYGRPAHGLMKGAGEA